MPIPRVLVRLLRHHEQGQAGTVIAVRPEQATRLIADGLAVLDVLHAPAMPPAPEDVVETPAPETATAAPARPRRKH